MSTSTETKTVDLSKMTPEERKAHDKAVRDKNAKEMKEARATVAKFMQTDEFKTLSKDIQAAINRITGKARGGATSSPFNTLIVEMFPKVKTAVNELDIFKKTKMGRGEFRKKVREALKSAEPAARHWIEFDEASESWVLLSVGEKMPKGFKGAAID